MNGKGPDLNTGSNSWSSWESFQKPAESDTKRTEDPRKIKRDNVTGSTSSRGSTTETDKSKRISSSTTSAFENLRSSQGKENIKGEKLSGGINLGQRLDNFLKGVQDLWNSISWSSIFSCFKKNPESSIRESPLHSTTQAPSQRASIFGGPGVPKEKPSKTPPEASSVNDPPPLRTQAPSQRASIFGGPGIPKEKPSQTPPETPSVSDDPLPSKTPESSLASIFGGPGIPKEKPSKTPPETPSVSDDPLPSKTPESSLASIFGGPGIPKEKPSQTPPEASSANDPPPLRTSEFSPLAEGSKEADKGSSESIYDRYLPGPRHGGLYKTLEQTVLSPTPQDTQTKQSSRRREFEAIVGEAYKGHPRENIVKEIIEGGGGKAKETVQYKENRGDAPIKEEKEQAKEDSRIEESSKRILRPKEGRFGNRQNVQAREETSKPQDIYEIHESVSYKKFTTENEVFEPTKKPQTKNAEQAKVEAQIDDIEARFKKPIDLLKQQQAPNREEAKKSLGALLIKLQEANKNSKSPQEREAISTKMKSLNRGISLAGYIGLKNLSFLVKDEEKRVQELLQKIENPPSDELRLDEPVEPKKSQKEETSGPLTKVPSKQKVAHPSLKANDAKYRQEVKAEINHLIDRLQIALEEKPSSNKDKISKKIEELKSMLKEGRTGRSSIDFATPKRLQEIVQEKKEEVDLLIGLPTPKIKKEVNEVQEAKEKTLNEMNGWSQKHESYIETDALEILKADSDNFKDRSSSFYFLLKDKSQPEKFHVTYIEKGEVIHHEIEVMENGKLAVGDQKYDSYEKVKTSLGFNEISRYQDSDAESILNERSISISANDSAKFLEKKGEVGKYILRKSGDKSKKEWVLEYPVGNKDFDEVRIKILGNGKYEVTDVNGTIDGSPFNTFEAITKKLDLGESYQQEEIKTNKGEKQKAIPNPDEFKSNLGWKNLNTFSRGNSLEDAKSFLSGKDYKDCYFVAKGDTPDKFHIVYEKDSQVVVHDIVAKRNKLYIGEKEFEDFKAVKAHLEDELEGLDLFSKKEAKENIDERRIDITKSLPRNDSIKFLSKSGEKGRYILRQSTTEKEEFVIDYSVEDKEFETVRVRVLESGKYEVLNYKKQSIDGSPFTSFKAIKEALELKAPYKREDIVTANEKQHKKMISLSDQGTRPSDKEIQDYLKGSGQFIMFPSGSKQGKYVIFLPEKKYIEVTDSGNLKFEGSETRYSSFEELKQAYNLGAPITSAEVRELRPGPIDINKEIEKQTQTLLKGEKEIISYLEKQEPGAYLFQKLDDHMMDNNPGAEVTQRASTALYFKTEKGTVARVGLIPSGSILLVIPDKIQEGQGFRTYTIPKMKEAYGLTELHDDAKIKQQRA